MNTKEQEHWMRYKTKQLIISIVEGLGQKQLDEVLFELQKYHKPIKKHKCKERCKK